jgi:hypothetical protein
MTTRTALITTAAMTTASAVGNAADAIAVHLGYAGAGPAVTAIVAVWMFDRLNGLIDDTK